MPLHAMHGCGLGYTMHVMLAEQQALIMPKHDGSSSCGRYDGCGWLSLEEHSTTPMLSSLTAAAAA